MLNFSFELCALILIIKLNLLRLTRLGGLKLRKLKNSTKLLQFMMLCKKFFPHFSGLVLPIHSKILKKNKKEAIPQQKKKVI